MRRHLQILAFLALLAPTALAGVVIETDTTVEGEGSGTETVYVEGEMFRTDPASIGKGDDMSVIFRDDTMWFLDHEKKQAQKIDKRTLEELAAQLDEMMRQMEQMPEAQQKMMRKMMKGKMPGTEDPPVYRVEKGEATQIGDVPCVLRTLYSDDRKVTEVCAADETAVAELGEAMAAVGAMARFAEDLRKMASNMPFGDMLGRVQATIPEIEGYPVRTRWFDRDGKVTRESTLRSIEKRALDAALFDVPKGYKVKDLGKELKKGR